MGIGRVIVGVLAASMSLTTSVPAIALPNEPLIVTEMADPDPYYVGPMLRSKHRSSAPSAELEDNARVDQAMAQFGRVIGEATLTEQQLIAAKCRQRLSDNATPEQRFAWAASCRYSRH